MKENVWITGVGLLSCLGEGAKENFNALMQNKKINIDDKTYPPYPVHVLDEIQWDKQIAKRDIRQMGQWQIIGTYSAGLALQDANITKENETLNNKTDMIIAARGSVCDTDVSKELLDITKDKSNQQAQPIITQYLCDNLRPTLFLTQLPNLLAGNISIVHKITGSSRTFMGEEGAGIAAAQTAFQRIQNKQSEITLVGGAFTAQCLETLLCMELNKRLYKGTHKPIQQRIKNNQHGMIMGSLGAFIVMESESHAKARGVRPYCQIKEIISDSCNREKNQLKNNFKTMLEKINNKPSTIISGTSGLEKISQQELELLNETIDTPTIRHYNTKLGQSMEAQFPCGLALAALSLQNNQFYPPFEKDEAPPPASLDSILITTIGASQAEGIAVLTKIGDKT